MKICHVDPACGIPIPPPSWGAIEKLIWEFKCNQEKLGHEVHIRNAANIQPGEFDMVHCHVANLALLLAERGIPYVYQIHDHHAYHYGKESEVYKQNLKAIENSLIALMPAKFLVNYFDSDKCVYFSHGVNTDFYYPDFNKEKTGTFLMVANNGLGGHLGFDRKGFGFGIALASKLNLPITIAGPSNNRHFINENLWVTSCPNVNFKFDLNQEEVRDLYQTHKIFVHASMLEAGHPNLTMVEAAACGLPIIAWWEMETDFHGAWRAPRDVLEMERGYYDIMNHHDRYIQNSLNTAQELSWFNRSKELCNLYLTLQ